jgi:predicted nucleotidyltransferase component of viral defense system
VKSNAYATPAAFRQALETRLGDLARSKGVDIQRLRKQTAFDRLLCRLFQLPGNPLVLKGGYAMELRLAGSRTTRDIDLVARGSLPGPGRLQERILRLLQAGATLDLKDFFVYSIGQPMRDLDGAPYGGARYPVEVRMAGRTFARFHLDVASGDPVLEPIQTLRGGDWLVFAGVDSVPFSMISKEQQFAEKLHAYTLPRGSRSNTRVRDLVDMFLLVRTGMDARLVRDAVQAVFKRRGTHLPPDRIPVPPADWVVPFDALAKECGLNADAGDAHKAIAAFCDTGSIL